MKLRNLIKRIYFKIRKPRISKFPEIISLELSTICNAKCKFCPHDKIKRDKIMDEKIFRKIINECVGHEDLKIIKPQHYGEPFVTPRFFEQLRYIRRKLPSVKIKIVTNAASLTKEKSDLLINENLCDEINFSLDAAEKKTFEEFKKLPYEIVINNINYFIKQNKKQQTRKIETIVSFVHTKENYNQLSKFKKIWKNKIDKFHISTEVGLGRRGDFFNERTNLYCLEPFRRLSILSTGEVIMCCADVFCIQRMGNVKKDIIYDIWNGLVFKKIRELHLRGKKRKIPLCKNCNEWS
jgi:MoaA/NifB/PqqE/SkfB family radical SAM enzyme